MMTAGELGEAVREYRRAMGLTQVQFGWLAGLSGRSVSTIESGRGNPKLRTLGRIEAVLEVVVQHVNNRDGLTRAMYVRGAWVERDLFCAVVRAATGMGLGSNEVVQHCYMRLMPNEQPYMLKNDLERGWWKATVWEVAWNHDPATARYATVQFGGEFYNETKVPV